MRALNNEEFTRLNEMPLICAALHELLSEYTNQCGAAAVADMLTFSCTRGKGHTGPHIAHGRHGIGHIWDYAE